MANKHMALFFAVLLFCLPLATTAPKTSKSFPEGEWASPKLCKTKSSSYFYALNSIREGNECNCPDGRFLTHTSRGTPYCKKTYGTYKTNYEVWYGKLPTSVAKNATDATCDDLKSRYFFALRSILDDRGKCSCPLGTDYDVVKGYPRCVGTPVSVKSRPEIDNKVTETIDVREETVNEQRNETVSPARNPSTEKEPEKFWFNDWSCARDVMGNTHCARVSDSTIRVKLNSGQTVTLVSHLRYMEYEGDCVPYKCSSTFRPHYWVIGINHSNSCVVGKDYETKQEFQICGEKESKKVAQKILPYIATTATALTISAVTIQLFLTMAR